MFAPKCPDSHARFLTSKNIRSLRAVAWLLAIAVAVTALGFAAIANSTALTTERRAHTATRLQDGRVLVVGGENPTGALNGTEIFDPASGTFSVTGNMNDARADHAATLLADGRVLITGGRNGAGSLSTTEIFDPATGTFASGPSLSVARAGHSATLFGDGRVFVAGGDASGSAEIIDAGLSGSTAAGSMSGGRSMHSAALLSDGRVLLVGGRDATGNPLDSGQIFSAGSGFSSAENEMKVARVRPHLRVLFDGKIQIIGGSNDGSMEIYDPQFPGFGAYAHVLPESDPCAGLHGQILASQTRAALFHTGSADALLDRAGHTITELGGQALIVGGANGAGAVLSSTAVVASSAAAISTDKMDYAPGETATITGRGFAAGETVRVKIHEDPHTPQERGFDVVADGEGNFTGQYFVMDYDLNMKFIVGARGLTSGMTAQTTFTDANNFNVTPLSQTVTAGTVQTFVWTYTALNSANVATTTFTIPAGWPAPQTAAGPGQVTVTAGTCAASLNNISGQVITINQATGGCNNTTTFTLTYANVTVPTPASPPQTYTFVTQHGNDPTVTVNGAGPTKLAFTTGDHNGTYGQCLPAISIQTQNAANTPTNVLANTTVNLASGNFGAGGSGAFFSDSGCTTPITSVLIATGNNSASFFYKATGRGDGSHDITVSASGLTSATQTQTINAASLTITATNKTKTYGDTVVFDQTTPSTDFSVAGLVNSDTVDSITLTSTGAAATATVAGSPYDIVPSAAVGTGLSNYNISYVNGSLTVEARDLTITATNKTKTYGDTVVFDQTTPSTDFSVAGLVNADTVDSITLTSTGAAATATVAGSPYDIVPSAAVGTGLTNYNISYVNGSLTVEARDLTITASNKTKTYGDTVIFDQTTPSTDFSVAGLVNSDTVDSITLTSTGAAATATVAGSPYDIVPSAAVGTGLTNYNISYVNGSLTVEARDLTITATNKTKTYGDTVVFDQTTPSTDFSVAGLVNSDTVDSITLTSTGAAATATVAGSPYDIVPSAAVGTGLTNYNISYVNGSLTVEARDLTITATNKTKTYGDTVVFDQTTPSSDFSVAGLVNSDTVDSITLTSTGAAATATVAGSPYDIVPSAAAGTGVANYDITYVNGKLTVNKAALTITASSHTITFNDPVPTITASYTGFVAGDDPTDLTVQPTCSTTYTVGSLIGTYPTKCENASSGNYTFTYVNGTVTVLTACSAFNGFLPPIGGSVETATGGSFANPVRSFKLNSTIPVKFNAICFGVPLTTGIHTLQAIKYNNATTSEDPIDATPTDSATSGNQFRLTGTEWHFNLSTKGLGNSGQGTWLLRATLFDGSTYTVWVAVKK
ncbi:MAG TPA: MBG domain-containing protein [Pyrinomonadaceae bacterium]|nr:MBG domain-containing protein [Pyrinomonadaceae bacterium]